MVVSFWCPTLCVHIRMLARSCFNSVIVRYVISFRSTIVCFVLRRLWKVQSANQTFQKYRSGKYVKTLAILKIATWIAGAEFMLKIQIYRCRLIIVGHEIVDEIVHKISITVALWLWPLTPWPWNLLSVSEALKLILYPSLLLPFHPSHFSHYLPPLLRSGSPVVQLGGLKEHCKLPRGSAGLLKWGH